MKPLDRCRVTLSEGTERGMAVVRGDDLAKLIALADAGIKARSVFYDLSPTNRYRDIVSGVMEAINPPLAALTKEDA